MISFMDRAKLYAVYHQKSLTRYIHMISVPLFILSWMILFSCVHVSVPGLFDVNVAMILTVVALIYYYRLNWRLALVITPLLVLLCWLGNLFSSPNPSFFTLSSAIIILVLACLMWYAGFYLEGKYPALRNHAQQLFIAPLLIAADVVFMTKQMRELEEDLYGTHHEKTHNL